MTLPPPSPPEPLPSAQLLLGRFQRERLGGLVVERLSALHGLGAVGNGLHELGYLLVLLGWESLTASWATSADTAVDSVDSPPSAALAICLANRMARSTAAPCDTLHSVESSTSSSYMSSSIRNVFLTLATVGSRLAKCLAKRLARIQPHRCFPSQSLIENAFRADIPDYL